MVLEDNRYFHANGKYEIDPKKRKGRRKGTRGKVDYIGNDCEHFPTNILTGEA